MRGPGAGGGSGLKRLTSSSSSSKKYHKLGADDYDDANVKKGLTLRGFCKILYPFFLPSKGSDDSSTNRRRAVSTYLTLLLSKSANIISPLYISKATNALVAKNYDAAVEAIVIFSCLKFITVACKELQTILFIKIKQEALSLIHISEPTRPY